MLQRRSNEKLVLTLTMKMIHLRTFIGQETKPLLIGCLFHNCKHIKEKKVSEIFLRKTITKSLS